MPCDIEKGIALMRPAREELASPFDDLPSIGVSRISAAAGRAAGGGNDPAAYQAQEGEAHFIQSKTVPSPLPETVMEQSMLILSFGVQE